jgi:hypothetical protein
MAFPVVNKIANEQDHKTRHMELMAEMNMAGGNFAKYKNPPLNNFLTVVYIIYTK